MWETVGTSPPQRFSREIRMNTASNRYREMGCASVAIIFNTGHTVSDLAQCNLSNKREDFNEAIDINKNTISFEMGKYANIHN